MTPLAQKDVPQTLHIPTSDGGIEHTEAEFLPADEWLSRAQAGSIILFPPQFFLLSLVADYLKAPVGKEDLTLITKTLQSQRDALLEFVETGNPPWGEKCISPWPLKKEGKRLVMGLDDPGPELEGTSRKGDSERVIWAQFKGNEGSSGLQVGWRREVTLEGVNGEESQEYIEARRKEREKDEQDRAVERALRGNKENL